jgi:hypothetical protein
MMKRKLLSAAAVVGFGVLAFSLVSIAQPITSGSGLSRVTTDTNFTGSGTTTNPLGVGNTFTVKDLRGTVSTTGGLSGTNNNLGISATATVARIETAGTTTITGIASGAEGRVLLLEVKGAHSVTLANDNAGSTAANRFYTLSGADQTIPTKGGAVLVYSSAESRWRVVAINGGGGISGTGTNNTITKWTGTSTLGDSSITDNGTSVSVPVTFVTTGNTNLGNGTSDLVTVQGGIGLSTTLAQNHSLAVQSDSTGDTNDMLAAVRGYNARSYANSGSVNSIGVSGINASTPDGSGTLTNIGVYGSSTLGDVNYSGYFDSGSFRVNGTTQLYASTITIGDASSDALTVGATSSFTAPATVGDLRGTTASTSSGSNINDFATASTTTILRVDPSANIDLTGLQGGAAGRVLVVVNVDTSGTGWKLTLKRESGSSTAANRLALPRTDVILAEAGSAAVLVYDGTTSRWRVVGVDTGRFYDLFADNRFDVTNMFTCDPGIGECRFLDHAQANRDFEAGDAEADALKLTGKPYAQGSAPALSSCGTSPTITGNDKAGTVTLGTGSPTACTLTFNAAWSTNAPICVVSTNTASRSYRVSSSSTTAITVTQDAAADSASFNYHCMGRL